MKAWNDLRDAPLSDEDIIRYAERYHWLGIGVVGGFGGLCPIDVDTDDKEVLHAIGTAVPRPNVAKMGSKGFTGFWRMREPIRGSKIVTPGKDGRPLVEILTTGNTVLPPTMHPKIGKPYRWLTQRTLFNTRPQDLVEIGPEHIEALRAVLEPWAPKKVVPPTQPQHRGPIDDHRMLAFAEARLANAAGDLTAQLAGRTHAAYIAGAKVGKFVHHGILSLAEVGAALMLACKMNGLQAKRGEAHAWLQIRNGIDKAKSDSLPNLDELAQKSGRNWTPRYEKNRQANTAGA
jgi:hypothetical protein